MKISFYEICTPEIIHSVEVLKDTEIGNIRYLRLSKCKSNLLQIDETTIRPSKIEIFKSGKCVLWYAYPKGKSFSQNLYGSEIKIN